MENNIKSVVVLGSGTMGAGIAALAADNNCKVLLLDISEEAVKKGKERIVNEKNFSVFFYYYFDGFFYRG